MDLESLLDKAGHGQMICLSKHREKASQILKAVEGLSIWEARELLQACGAALVRTEISYSSSRSDTTA